MPKKADGVFWKRADDRRIKYYWKIDREKSKDFLDQKECATEYVTKYIERYPKYKELVYDKTWDEIFRIFGISLIPR